MTRRLLEHLNHELRSPMTVVVGMTDLMLIAAKEEEPKQLLQSVRQATDAMLRILDEAVDFSRLESGVLQLDEASFPLKDVTARAAQVLAVGPAPLALFTTIDADVPATLVGDPQRLRQMIEALVRSCAKLRPGREFDLRVSACQSSSDVWLSFAFGEHGRPLDAMADEKEERLRVTDFAERGYLGSGLGLPVSAGLAELMGGELWMASDNTSPRLFRLTARFRAGDLGRGGDLLADVERRLEASASNVAPLRVLLAEDTAGNREFFRRVLEQRGHSVVAVANGEEAVRAFDSADLARGFDVALLDVEMPVLDGRETASALRARERFKHRPFSLVALTAHATGGDTEFAVSGLFDAAITKPCDLKHLYSVIESLPQAPQSDAAAGMAPMPQVRPAVLPEGAPRVDYRGTLARLGGNGQLLLDLASFFREDAPAILLTLSAALDNGDAQGVERAAHSLKGLVANFGAKEAIGLTSELQNRGHENRLDDAMPLFRRLEAEINFLRGELAEFCHANATRGAAGDDSSRRR